LIWSITGLQIVKSRGHFIARSFSFFWYKRIYVGTEFKKLPRDEKAAVLAHEEGHCENHHTEKRMLALLFPFQLMKMCHQQELEADTHAGRLGHATALIEVIRRGGDAGSYYPPIDARVKNLKQYSLDPR